MIYGMLRNPVTRSANGARIRLSPDVCPTCGQIAWKTALADNIAKRGGRVLCTRCAMSIAWNEE